ncbi:MAG: recombinase family protein [Bacteroidia bacterium]|nr:recombinase family protein [Bacteroidia bacterium]
MAFDDQLEALHRFARGEVQEVNSTKKNAVIYTRVSSKEQTENLSLDTQLQAILKFAQNQSYSIVSTFGGTYESAKDDEREEFQRMLNFVKRNKGEVNSILVYSFDRFSRSGANSIFLSEQLRQQGIQIVSVTQPTNTFTPSGELHQNIMMVFSHFDNQLRKQKTIAGMKERLLRGYWTGIAPKGYDYDRKQREKPLVQTPLAKVVKRAFYLKAVDGLSNAEILRKLEPLGLKVNQKSLSKIFSNPIYAGYLSNKLLDGQLVKGNHKAIVSKEIFLRANESKRQIGNRIRQTEANVNVPLKNFVLCSSCMTCRLTGYEMKARGIWYYKCSKKSCCHNVSAEKLHSMFFGLLKRMTIDKRLKPKLKLKLISHYKSLNEGKQDEVRRLKAQLIEIQKELDLLEERYALGKIQEGVYEKVSAKRLDVKQDLERKLFGLIPQNKSNIEEFVDFALNLASNLHKAWKHADVTEKTRIQNFVFPNGIIYNSVERKITARQLEVIMTQLYKMNDDRYLEGGIN